MDVRQKQKPLVYMAATIIRSVFIILTYNVLSDSKIYTAVKEQHIKIELPDKKLSKQELLMNQMENEAKLQSKKIELMENMVSKANTPYTDIDKE